ncbi:MAG: CHASE domain-containing protein, partial [Deltaproteobacteria bacterium]|nr:CHASE domain-containing protein [Deltaproteobacteria bacterium]
QRIVAHQEALSALRRLIEVTPDMSFRQFEYFTAITLKDNPDVFALSFNPYVSDRQRESFEKEIKIMLKKHKEFKAETWE